MSFRLTWVAVICQRLLLRLGGADGQGEEPERPAGAWQRGVLSPTEHVAPALLTYMVPVVLTAEFALDGGAWCGSASGVSLSKGVWRVRCWVLPVIWRQDLGFDARVLAE